MDETNIKKRLSIIVPVYNVEKYIERCLLSLLNQDIPKSEYEIIVVNDGTPDNSADIAQSIADKNENIIVIHRENGGLSAARNTGIKHAKGNYLFYVDSDDFIEKNILGQLLAIAENNQLDICMFKPMVYTDEGEIIKFNRPSYADNNIHSGDFLLVKDKAMTSVWHALYNRLFLERVGILFHEGLIHEDIHYHLKLFPHAKRIMINDIDGYYYCQNGESIMRTKNNQKIFNSFKSRLFIIKDIKDYSKDNDFSETVNTYYSTLTNSMLVATLLNIIQNPILAIKEKDELITYAKKNKIFPLWKVTKSLKSTILLFFFNIPFIINILFHFNFLHKKDKQEWS